MALTSQQLPTVFLAFLHSMATFLRKVRRLTYHSDVRSPCGYWSNCFCNVLHLPGHYPHSRRSLWNTIFLPSNLATTATTGTGVLFGPAHSLQRDHCRHPLHPQFWMETGIFGPAIRSPRQVPATILLVVLWPALADGRFGPHRCRCRDGAGSFLFQCAGPYIRQRSRLGAICARWLYQPSVRRHSLLDLSGNRIRRCFAYQRLRHGDTCRAEDGRRAERRCRLAK